MQNPPGTIQSVGKAVSILRIFADGQPQRVSDIARSAGIGQSTASRLLSTLENAGLLDRDPVGNLYRLGPELITLGGAALNQHPLFRASRQILQNLAGHLGLGTNVAILSDGAVLYLANFEGPEAPRNHTIAGRRDPIHATSMGKCLLLGVPEEQRAAMLGDLERYTEATITNIAQLNLAVSEVERRGYAVDVDEFALGRASVAAPIRDSQGGIAGAMTISGPATALRLERRQDELAAHAIETADRIGSSLGFTASRS
ncbi:IclR family transcriptional regulator [Leifsonia flava]|nr:IclR family transcriptional regulator [Leifsonia flava]